jgi:tRNA-dihydrouridine synthase C
MRIFLAPMEGVVNHIMRDLISARGGIDRCVTEFVRVTDQLLPRRVFYRLCPELHNQSQTPAGTPVYIQLLGSKPDAMAANAWRAAELGAAGIDLNFGCPAKTVNRSNGGSILLREPERVESIIRAVRQATPDHVPVTVKIRLGYEDTSQFAAICDAVFSAQASELIIHARTKADGYKPPAHWQHIAPVAKCSPIPIIANGEIWTAADYPHCQQQSGCQDVMLGRGLLSNPNLAEQIRGTAQAPLSWHQVLSMLLQQLDATIAQYPAKYAGNPTKQWLGYLRRQYPQAQLLLENIKRLKQAEPIQEAIHRERDQAELAPVA